MNASRGTTQPNAAALDCGECPMCGRPIRTTKTYRWWFTGKIRTQTTVEPCGHLLFSTAVRP